MACRCVGWEGPRPPEASPPSPTSAAGEAAVRGRGQRWRAPRSPALRTSPEEQTVLTWCRCASSSPVPRRRHGSGRSARGGRTGVGSGSPGAPLLGGACPSVSRGVPGPCPGGAMHRPGCIEVVVALPGGSRFLPPVNRRGRSRGRGWGEGCLLIPLGFCSPHWGKNAEWPDLGVWPGAAWGRLLRIPRRAALLTVLQPGEGCPPRGSGSCSGDPAGLCAPTTVLYGLSCGE